MFGFHALRDRLSATADFMGATTTEMTDRLAKQATPDDGGITTLALLGGRVIFIRSAVAMRELSASEALGRGSSLNLLRSIFVDSLFLLSHGSAHRQRKQEFKDHLGKPQVTALVPTIAHSAVAAVDRLKALAEDPVPRPVDMTDAVLGYLFGVASNAIAGEEADLSGPLTRFRKNADIALGGASSTIASAVAAIHRQFAQLVARPARAAAHDMLDIGEALARTAAKSPHRACLASAMMTRHGVDPASVKPGSRLPEALLYDITTSFAASIFTSTHFILTTLDHYYQRPDELQTLREHLRQDFPGGVGEVTALRHCDSIRLLLPVMLSHSPVGAIVRDVVAPKDFTDELGQRHHLHAGDAVVFDLTTLQSSQAEALRQRLQGASGPLLDQLDARHNDVIKAFLDGPFQCPGRYLVIADSVLFLVECLSRLQGRWTDGPRTLQRGLVDRLSGSSRMDLQPVQARIPPRMNDVP